MFPEHSPCGRCLGAVLTQIHSKETPGVKQDPKRKKRSIEARGQGESGEETT